MLSAEKIKMLASLGPHGLSALLDHCGYSMATFKTVEFIGINTSNQFVYRVSFHDESGTGQVEFGRVYVTYDHELDKLIADY